MRTEEIRPPSLRQETFNVLKATVAVVVLVAAYLMRPAILGGTSERSASSRPSNLLPYQSLVGDAPGLDQRMFRELQEGLLESERVRANSGRWPDASALAADGVPPFVPDPTRKDVAYRWTTLVQGTTVNYLGVPSKQAAPAWLLVVVEPEPGAPPDPAPNDETHHRLPDGTTLHVGIWRVVEQSRRSGFNATPLPENEGWTQLMIGAQSK